MPVPFSPRAEDPRWIASVADWIDRRLAERNITRLSEPRRQHVRAWSILLTVETDAGRLWFKALCEPMRFEAALVPRVSAWVPQIVRAPLAADPREGWLLTAEHPPPLAESAIAETTEDWCVIMRHLARLQQATLDRRDDILAAGTMDASLPTVLDRFDEITEGLGTLDPGDPAHLSGDEATAVRAARSLVADAVACLADSGLPHALQHGDVHRGNIEVGTLRLFDFGDAQWALAAESLIVPRRVIERDATLDLSAIEGAYAEAWGGICDRALSEEYRDAITVTHEVNRAALWWRAMTQMTGEEWIQWGGSPKEHLLNITRVPA